jgi:hypothetical protein
MIARFVAEADATFVRHTTERLLNEQAFVGKGRIDATPGQVSNEPPVIEFGRVAAQGELETVLPGELAVTGAHVAAGASEDRLHVLPKRRRASRGRGADRHRHPAQFAAEFDDDLRRAIAFGVANSIRRHGNDVWIAAGEPGQGGDISLSALARGSRHEQTMGGLRSIQGNAFRPGDQIGGFELSSPDPNSSAGQNR